MDLPKRKPNRIPHYDYSTPHAYFITVCTANRRNLFWDDVSAATRRPCLSSYGEIVAQCIQNIPLHYPAITVDCYTVMPNHIHLLLQIHTDCDGRRIAAPTISTVVNQLKGTATRQAGFSLWQKGFYDHVVRGEKDYRDIWLYIESNPMKWSEDILYTL